MFFKKVKLITFLCNEEYYLVLCFIGIFEGILLNLITVYNACVTCWPASVH